ncbi:hypothetical protein pCPXV0248 [Cowpox virus]|uniref:Uncharacterized protein n=1 Tax=Cowpox virus TaxID=10243 RepID=A0A212PPG2_COWPX|nr:hypothetical protein pCPXV0248 [Cowpox virus]SNB52749.1 hypothetical protein pCPXV0248 [Cowpox virus]SNB57473.1 hypothetical protein pCPXV0248 [Cowpox virus]
MGTVFVPYLLVKLALRVLVISNGYCHVPLKYIVLMIAHRVLLSSIVESTTLDIPDLRSTMELILLIASRLKFNLYRPNL